MRIAIDPGKSGGIVVENGNGEIFAHAMPATNMDTIELLKEYVTNFNRHVSNGIEDPGNITAPVICDIQSK